MKELQSRKTLEKARFFAAQATSVGTDDREAYVAFLEAAIVFGRSVTFHLQKELSATAGFDGWYAIEQQRLSADPVAKYLLDQRNYLLKEGSLEIRLDVGVHLSAVVPMTASLSFVVNRSQPWYRRSRRILVNDAIRPLRTWFAQRRERARARRHIRRVMAQQEATVVVRVVQFAGSPFGDTPAVDLLEQYFQALEKIVSRAENSFPHTD